MLVSRAQKQRERPAGAYDLNTYTAVRLLDETQHMLKDALGNRAVEQQRTPTRHAFCSSLATQSASLARSQQGSRALLLASNKVHD